MKMTVEDCCNYIVQEVKSSNLHYHFQENPFAIQIKIRKKFIDDKIWNNEYEKTNLVETLEKKLKIMEEKFESKREECEHLKKDKMELKAEVTKTSDELYETNVELTKQYGVIKDMAQRIESQRIAYENFQNELSAAAFKKESDLAEKLSQARNDIKESESKVKDVIEANKKLYKEIRKIKQLKSTETRNKSLGIISGNNTNEGEDSFDVNQNDIKPSYSTLPSRSSSSKVSTVDASVSCRSVSCQTKSHPDIPYHVTSKLPPIFSSEPCYTSRPIFLSNSLPNLASISQFPPTYDFTDEAEEALMEQHERHIREFYADERDRVRAARTAEPDHWPTDHHHHQEETSQET